ncbi:uncharacterized protein LOC143035587 [Oratosquilla oratoria]|uniref:uncharacterized protein LOC143035587 n=1 Tax=Oratosquilla oratoria TaxID=337810 RepID=UPI003F76DF43
MPDRRFDNILTKLGTGRWNFLHFISVGLWYIVIPMHALAGTFLSPEVEFECQDESAFPTGVATNSSHYLSPECSFYNETTEEFTSCSVWSYDNSTFTNTITSEFHLVCERRYLGANFQKSYVFGTLVGAILNALAADFYGRKTVLVVGAVIFSFFSLVAVWLPSFSSILAARFAVGLAHPVLLHSGYSLALEVCEPRLRAIVGITIGLPWALGTVACGVLGYLIRDWRWLQLAISVPSLVFLPTLWFLDESPRWLMVKGKEKRVLKTLQRASRWNGVLPPTRADIDSLLDRLDEGTTTKTLKKNTHHSFPRSVWRTILFPFILCRSSKMCCITLILYFNFFVASMIFYSFTFRSGIYMNNPFLHIIIAGLLEVPGYTATAPIVSLCGRKRPVIVGYALCALMVLSLTVVPSNITWLTKALVVAGNFLAVAVYQGLFLYANELFPTSVRLYGIGTSFVTFEVGTILSPFIYEALSPLYPWLPPLLVGVLSLGACLATIFLHDTKGTPLPDTVFAHEVGDDFCSSCSTLSDISDHGGLWSLVDRLSGAFRSLKTSRGNGGRSNVDCIESCQIHEGQGCLRCIIPPRRRHWPQRVLPFLAKLEKHTGVQKSSNNLLVPGVQICIKNPYVDIFSKRRTSRSIISPPFVLTCLHLEATTRDYFLWEFSDVLASKDDPCTVPLGKMKVLPHPYENPPASRRDAPRRPHTQADTHRAALSARWRTCRPRAQNPPYSTPAACIQDCEIPDIYASSRMTRGFRRRPKPNAPLSLEILATTWAASKCKSYSFGLPHLSLMTDHRPLIPILTSGAPSPVTPALRGDNPWPAADADKTLLGLWVAARINPAYGHPLPCVFSEFSSDRLALPDSVPPYWKFRATLSAVKELALYDQRIAAPAVLREHNFEDVDDGSDIKEDLIDLRIEFNTGQLEHLWTSQLEAYHISEEKSTTLEVLVPFATTFLFGHRPKNVFRGVVEHSDPRFFMLTAAASRIGTTPQRQAKFLPCNVPMNTMRMQAFTATETHRELDRIRQHLTNNGYADHLIADVIKNKMDQDTNDIMSGTSLDSLLTRLGTGRWNFIFFCSVGLLFMLTPLHILTSVLLSPAQEHECVLPFRGGSQGNTSSTQDECYMFNATTGEDLVCTEWTYDSSFTKTVTSEFDLVCSRSYLRATFQSVFMFGSVVGAILYGMVSDAYGRRPTILVSSLVLLILGMAPIWLSSLGFIFACRFLVGMTIPAYTGVAYGLALEVCQAHQRAKVGIFIGLPWAFGVMILGGLGYFIRDWRYLQMTISLPFLVIIPVFWLLLDESPRWLMVKGKTDELLKVLQRAARLNKGDPPTVVEVQMAIQASKDEELVMNVNRQSIIHRIKRGVASFFILCRMPRIRLVTFVVCFDTFAVAMVFYGLSLGGSGYTDDPYLYLVISGLMEIPGYTLTAPILDYFGRKKPIIVGYITCGIAILATINLPPSLGALTMTLVMIGKMCITGTYQALILYITEIYPTEVRTTGLGTSIFASRVATVLTPYITEVLRPIYPWLMPGIFGGCSIVAGMSTLLLHETLNTKLPDTIHEFESSKSSQKEFRILTFRTKLGQNELRESPQSHENQNSKDHSLGTS